MIVIQTTGGSIVLKDYEQFDSCYEAFPQDCYVLMPSMDGGVNIGRMDSMPISGAAKGKVQFFKTSIIYSFPVDKESSLYKSISEADTQINAQKSGIILPELGVK